MLDRQKFATAAQEKVKTVKYSVLDCQAFVEWCANKAGYKFNARGSNDIYRNYTKAKGKTTSFNPTIGDVVFKWKAEYTGNSTKYKGDGIGNMYHIGILTVASGGKYEVCHSSNSKDNGKVDTYTSLAALGKVWQYAATLKNTKELVVEEPEAEEANETVDTSAIGAKLIDLQERLDVIQCELDKLFEAYEVEHIVG